MLFFLRRRVVSAFSVKLPKIQEKSTPKPPKSTPASCFYWFRLSSLKSQKNHPPNLQNQPQNLQKSILKRSKIHPKSLQNRGLEGIALRIAFGTLLFLNLGASWAVLRASWGRLGAVLGRLGCVLGRLGGILGASCGILERLGGVLGTSWGALGRFSIAKTCVPSWIPVSDRFLLDFCSQLRPPKTN